MNLGRKPFLVMPTKSQEMYVKQNASVKVSNKDTKSEKRAKIADCVNRVKGKR